MNGDDEGVVADPKTSALHSPAAWVTCYKWLDKHQGQPNYLRKACEKWPGYTTKALKYRWKNRVLDEHRHGPEPRLTLEGEAAFVEYLEMQQDVGNCKYVDDQRRAPPRQRRARRGAWRPPRPLTTPSTTSRAASAGASRVGAMKKLLRLRV